MKKKNVNLANRFFLLSNGDLVYVPNGLKQKDLIKYETNAKVLAFEIDEKGNLKINVPIDIVATADSIEMIEEKEKNYFINSRKKINYYFRNLLKVDHNYQPVDMYEHVQELINANRIRIIRRWKIAENKELQEIYTNIFII